MDILPCKHGLIPGKLKFELQKWDLRLKRKMDSGVYPESERDKAEVVYLQVIWPDSMRGKSCCLAVEPHWGLPEFSGLSDVEQEAYVIESWNGLPRESGNEPAAT